MNHNNNSVCPSNGIIMKRTFLIILTFNERIILILIKYNTTELSRIISRSNVTIRTMKLKKETVCVSVTMRRTLIRNRCYSIRSIWQINKIYWNSEWKFKLHFSYLPYNITIRYWIFSYNRLRESTYEIITVIVFVRKKASTSFVRHHIVI